MLRLHIQEASIVSSSVMMVLFYQIINPGVLREESVWRLWCPCVFICVLVKSVESGVRLLRENPGSSQLWLCDFMHVT